MLYLQNSCLFNQLQKKLSFLELKREDNNFEAES